MATSLRVARESRGQSQLELAALLGVHNSRVSYMERGERWTIENLEDVAAALGMRGWELLRMAEEDDVPDGSAEEAELVEAFRADGYAGVLAVVAANLRSCRETKR